MRYLFALLLLASCAKEEPRMARVEFHSVCRACVVESTGGGGSMEGSRTWEAMVEVGSEAFIRSTPTMGADTSAMVWITVDGFQQAMRYSTQPLRTPYRTDGYRAVEVRLVVPDLDKWGVAH